MLRGSVVFLGLFLMLAPPAEALGLKVVEAPAEPLPPDGAPGQVRTVVSMACQDLMVRDQAIVVYSFEHPGHVLVFGPASRVFSAERCAAPTDTATLENTFHVIPTMETPGLRSVPVTAHAAVAAGGPADIEPAEEAEPATFTVAADYVANTQVKLEDKVVGVDGGGDLRFTLQNYGNADTTWTFGVEAPKGFSIVLPDQVVGASILQGGDVVEVEATVSGSGSWEQQAIRIIVHSASSDDPSRTGNDVGLNVVLRNEAGFLGTPAPPVAPLLVLIALGAWVARRRA